MGKASSSKKVARAAGASGGRTSRGRAPVLWYSALLVIIAAGVGLTAFSRQERVDQLSSPSSQTPPRANQDHWHTAVGVYDCDKWLDPVTDQSDDDGIHTHADGIIHIHPFFSRVAGANATFGKFTSQVKANVENEELDWPAGSGRVKREKGDKCGDAEGVIKVFYDGKEIKGNPEEIKLTDRGKLVVAFVSPDRTAESIGDPPSVPGLDNLTDVEQPAAPGPEDPTVSTPPTSTSDTTAPGQPGATTTAPPAGSPDSTVPPTSAPSSTPPTSAAG